MGRDTSKQAKKKAASASSEYVSKMHDLSVQKIELFKETEGERKARLDEIVTIEKTEGRGSSRAPQDDAGHREGKVGSG